MTPMLTRALKAGVADELDFPPATPAEGFCSQEDYRQHMHKKHQVQKANQQKVARAEASLSKSLRF